MIKEVHEQPQTVAAALAGRTYEDRVLEAAFGPTASEVFDRVRSVQIVACGTAYHAGLVARHWFEGLAGVQCRVEQASEFRYRDPLADSSTLVVALSQSGETADTLGALREALTRGVRAVARHRECAEQLARARRGSCPDDQCGAGDRGCVDQGVHRPARSPSAAWWWH